MNHYEVYYKKLHKYSYLYREKLENGSFDFSKGMFWISRENMIKLADKAHSDVLKNSYTLYADLFSITNRFRTYGMDSVGQSHYPTGEMQFVIDEKLHEPDAYSLGLEIEKANIATHVEKEDYKISIQSKISHQKHFLIHEVSQSEGGLVKNIEIKMPKRRNLAFDVEYIQLDQTTFYYKTSFYPDGEDKERFEPFQFLVMTKLVGATGNAIIDNNCMSIRIDEHCKQYQVVTTVVTEDETTELLEAAKNAIVYAITHIKQLNQEHQTHWKDFWAKSSITIPDRYLENLWYVNLYMLACCIGKNGRRYEQSLGLNGLWDIKQPTVWGSMWYWDVNIQASFWPFYTANHLELAEAFNDGLLAHSQMAEKWAREFHQLEGMGMDYPFSFYLCVWPWCAQYLWWYYRYSMDRSFLKEKAYPLFKKVLQFIEGYVQLDKEKNQYYFYPDISPEQGPVGRNTIITVATVKYLLKMAIESNQILSEAKEDVERWNNLLMHLAPYPTIQTTQYGEVIRDSEYAPAQLRLRHPSLLMPIYPIGEIDCYSDEKMQKIAENTLYYTEENMEIGTFQFGWLSCAASRMGKGNMALRVLYEKGIDVSQRANGLLAEETERWINFCNITNTPLYYPPMTEASGELVASVNEMLLQSYGGIIRVFPALPSGKCEEKRIVGQQEHRLIEKILYYPKWEDCAFEGLLAEGAFEVSASIQQGVVQNVTVKSLMGNTVRLRNPYHETAAIEIFEEKTGVRVEFTIDQEIISFDTQKGLSYGAKDALATGYIEQAKGEADEQAVQVRLAHTNRRVFLGKDRETSYCKMIDSFTYDYYAGNQAQSKVPVYRLDFSTDSTSLGKDYAKTLPRSVHNEGLSVQNFRRMTVQSAFTFYDGIGWEMTEGLQYVDRQTEDALRRDFIESDKDNAFKIELPKGRYDVLVVSGDSSDSSYTEIEVEGQGRYKPEKPLKAGEYFVEIIPVFQKKDGFVTFKFKTEEGYRWKLNAMIVNKLYLVE